MSNQEYWAKSRANLEVGDTFTTWGHAGAYVVLECTDADLYRVKKITEKGIKVIDVEELWKR